MTNRGGLSGKVITVLGEIAPDALGFTHSHEHVFCDLSLYFVEPADEKARELAHQPVTLENLHWVRYHWRDSLDCQQLLDENVAIDELARFKAAGGKTIVEASTRGLPRRPAALQRIARAVGINIVMGTGYYVGPLCAAEVQGLHEEELAAGFVEDIVSGGREGGVRAGMIGELGCSWPLQETERKVLRAAALAQQQTGAAISIHPGRNEAAPLEVIDILSGAGANLNRVVMCHMDRCGYELETRLALLRAGCYVEYDVFGTEGYYPAEAALADGHLPDMPNDVGRIKQIKELIELGFLKQILMSQDTCMKIQLTRWGGHGYAHILEHVLPLMKVYGMTDEQIRTLTIENPKRMLTIP